MIRPFAPDSVLSYAFIYPATAQRSEIVDEVKAEIIKDMNDALGKLVAGDPR